MRAARALRDCLRQAGILLQQATFEDIGDHPCHLKSGVARYAGLRWHIHLAGVGFRAAGPMAYVKAGGLQAVVQRLRFILWRGTGLWLVAVPAD